MVPTIINQLCLFFIEPATLVTAQCRVKVQGLITPFSKCENKPVALLESVNSFVTARRRVKVTGIIGPDN